MPRKIVLDHQIWDAEKGYVVKCYRNQDEVCIEACGAFEIIDNLAQCGVYKFTIGEIVNNFIKTEV